MKDFIQVCIVFGIIVLFQYIYYSIRVIEEDLAEIKFILENEKGE